MSQPDILSQIRVTSSDADANVETPTVTVADGGETQGLDKGVDPKQDDNVEQKPTAGEEANTESKTKDERKAEGRRIERKLNNLYKDRAEAQERAIKAETELAMLKQSLAERAERNKNLDLDELSFDDRVAHVANQQVEDRLIGEQAARLNDEIHQVKAYEWEEKRELAAQQFPDYYEVIQDAAPLLDALPPMLQDAIVNSEHGAHIAYTLAKDPNLAIKLARANPMEAAVHLLRMEQTYATPLQNSVPQAQASAPVVQAVPKVAATPTPTHSGNSPVQNFWELPMEDFMAMKRQQNRGRWV